jgi:hypothetical protein
VVAAQVAVTAALGLLWLLAGREQGVAALAGGAVAVAGTALFALRFLGPEHAGAGFVFARFVGATALKWLVMVGGLYVAIGPLGLPPLAVVTGFAAALVAVLYGLVAKDPA